MVPSLNSKMGDLMIKFHVWRVDENSFKDPGLIAE